MIESCQMKFSKKPVIEMITKLKANIVTNTFNCSFFRSIRYVIIKLSSNDYPDCVHKMQMQKLYLKQLTKNINEPIHGSQSHCAVSF